MSIIKNINAFKNWYLCYLIRYGMIKSECILETKSGIKFFLRPKTLDFKAVKTMFTKHEYLRGFVPLEEGDIVFDVGANIGAFSLLAAQKASKVFSFEPEPKNFEMFKRNIELNGFSNIIPLMKAISYSNSFIDFYLYPQDIFTGCHSLFKPQGGYSKRIQVETVTLKSILEQYKLPRIDFLKLDCEGAEYDILRSLDKKTASRIGKIVMETHKHRYTEKNIYDIPMHLENLGYEVMTEKDGKYVYARQKERGNN